MTLTALKIIGVICMTLDHFSTILGAPIWFRYIGRFAAVIFFFCAVESVVLTHDRRAYCKRLWFMSMGMKIVHPISAVLSVLWNDSCSGSTAAISFGAFMAHRRYADKHSLRAIELAWL